MVKKRSSFAQHGPYLAIVAVVAVVAIVFLILNFTGGKVVGKAIDGDANLCGNDQLDEGEECDSPPDNSGYFTKVCNDLNFYGGRIACTSECKLDTTGCNKCSEQENPVCEENAIKTCIPQQSWKVGAHYELVPCTEGNSCKNGVCVDKFDLFNYQNLFITQKGEFNGLLVAGEYAIGLEYLGLTDIAVSMRYNGQAVKFQDQTKLDSEVVSAESQNVISIGNPCVNTISAELLGNPADCTEGLTPKTARIKLVKHPNGNVGLVVDGYSSANTRLAAKVIAYRANELSGQEVLIEGYTWPSATITVVK